MPDKPQLPVLHPQEPLGFQLAKSAFENAQKDVERYRPLLERVAEAQRRWNETYEALGLPAQRLQEAMKPILEDAQRVREQLVAFSERMAERQQIFAKPVHILPKREYLSVDDIADAVYERLSERSALTEVNKPTEPKVTGVLPSDARWEDTELRFMDAHTVELRYKGDRKGSYDYADLGFARMNTKGKKFDKQWKLLAFLSIIAPHEKNFIASPKSLAVHLVTTPGGCEKIKSALAKKLRIAFGIQGDPFYPYDPTTGYQTRFGLVPEPDIRGDGELHASGSRIFDRVTPDETDQRFD